MRDRVPLLSELGNSLSAPCPPFPRMLRRGGGRGTHSSQDRSRQSSWGLGPRPHRLKPPVFLEPRDT